MVWPPALMYCENMLYPMARWLRSFRSLTRESRKKEKKQRVLRYGGTPGSNKDKCDKEVNTREKRMLQIRHKLTVAILIYTNIRKENRNLN